MLTDILIIKGYTRALEAISGETIQNEVIGLGEFAVYVEDEVTKLKIGDGNTPFKGLNPIAATGIEIKDGYWYINGQNTNTPASGIATIKVNGATYIAENGTIDLGTLSGQDVDLSNYYEKGETYSRTEINQLLNGMANNMREEFINILKTELLNKEW